MPFALTAGTGCGRRASLSPRVKITSVEYRDDGTNVIVQVHVANMLFDPIYIYTESVDTQYDAVTKTTTLVMHVVPTKPTGSSSDCHVHVLTFAKVPDVGGTVIELRLPRVRSVFSFSGATPRGASDSMFEARHARVELGWSRKPLELPFASRGKCRFDAETELQSLEDGIAIGVWP